MKLYNSYTQSVEPFVPMEEGKVSMYVCGPTVYNDPHIGNARPIVVFDTLARTFKALGYDVTYASNYTDVDDKIINKAIEENKTEKEITDRYIQVFHEVRQALGALDPDFTPRVTETMDQIIAFIDRMVANGSAYQAQGDVYFRVEADPHYGELSHQNSEDLKVGARISESEKKDNPLDFTLWKTTDKGIQWDSPWGKGRPGWHTECVVMIQDVFGRPLIDIHGGGLDLKFPHHENEVAQCRAVYDTPLANVWLHNGMINIDHEKMSKSKGNVLLAKDLIDQYGGNACRWMMISKHYRAPLDISDETLNQAKAEVEKMEKVLRQLLMKMALAGKTQQDGTIIESDWKAFLDALEDDLNTPNAITAVQQVIKQINQALRKREPDGAQLAHLYRTLTAMLDVLGIHYDLTMPDQGCIDLYRKWKQGVCEKDFQTADSCRAKLMEQGWI